MKKIATLIIMLSIPVTGFSVEIAGVKLPETIKTDGTILVLNGAGLRTKTFLKIKVYAAGLYLQEKSSDAAGIIAADWTMAVRMAFIYDGVSPEKLIDAWNEGFETAGVADSLRDEIKTFNSCFTKEAKEGDIFELAYLPGRGVEVRINKNLKAVIPGLSFKKALFSIWLGEDPCDDDLKDGLLGK